MIAPRPDIAFDRTCWWPLPTTHPLNDEVTDHSPLADMSSVLSMGTCGWSDQSIVRCGRFYLSSYSCRGYLL